MAVYTPLFVYLTPASIPQVVANIQKYLADNPILSDPEAIAEAIETYIEEHPEIIAVASVNGQTGNVVLTGSDININASQSVTIATQISNLATMISDTGGDIDTINDNIDDIYIELDGETGIKARLTTVESDINTASTGIKARLDTIEGEVNGTGGIDSRLTTVENDINAAQTGIKARLTEAEADVLTIDNDLNTASTGIKARLTSAEDSITTLQGFVNGISSFTGLRIEFGTIAVSSATTTFTFNQPFTTTPFVATSIDGPTNRALTVHLNSMSASGGTVVCKRMLDGTDPEVGWGGNATVRYMAIGS